MCCSSSSSSYPRLSSLLTLLRQVTWFPPLLSPSLLSQYSLSFGPSIEEVSSIPLVLLILLAKPMRESSSEKVLVRFDGDPVSTGSGLSCSSLLQYGSVYRLLYCCLESAHLLLFCACIFRFPSEFNLRYRRGFDAHMYMFLLCLSDVVIPGSVPFSSGGSICFCIGDLGDETLETPASLLSSRRLAKLNKV